MEPLDVTFIRGTIGDRELLDAECVEFARSAWPGAVEAAVVFTVAETIRRVAGQPADHWTWLEAVAASGAFQD